MSKTDKKRENSTKRSSVVKWKMLAEKGMNEKSKTNELKEAKAAAKQAEKEKKKALETAKRHQNIARRASMDVIEMAGRHMEAEKGKATVAVTAANLRFKLGAALKRVEEQQEEIKMLKSSASVLSKEVAINTGAHLAADENDPFEHGDGGFFRTAAAVSR